MRNKVFLSHRYSTTKQLLLKNDLKLIAYNIYKQFGAIESTEWTTRLNHLDEGQPATLYTILKGFLH